MMIEDVIELWGEKFVNECFEIAVNTRKRSLQKRGLHAQAENTSRNDITPEFLLAVGIHVLKRQAL